MVIGISQNWINIVAQMKVSWRMAANSNLVVSAVSELSTTEYICKCHTHRTHSPSQSVASFTRPIFFPGVCSVAQRDIFATLGHSISAIIFDIFGWGGSRRLVQNTAISITCDKRLNEKIRWHRSPSSLAIIWLGQVGLWAFQNKMKINFYSGVLGSVNGSKNLTTTLFI